MVKDRLNDGVRIGQLLASEVDGDRGQLGGITVADADPDVEPTADGGLAYRLVRTDDVNDHDRPESDADVVAEVYVQPDRVRVEFVREPDAAADAAGGAGLRVRPKATRPPRTLVFVEDGAEAKRIRPVIEAVSAANDGE